MSVLHVETARPGEVGDGKMWGSNLGLDSRSGRNLKIRRTEVVQFLGTLPWVGSKSMSTTMHWQLDSQHKTWSCASSYYVSFVSISEGLKLFSVFHVFQGPAPVCGCWRWWCQSRSSWARWRAFTATMTWRVKTSTPSSGTRWGNSDNLYISI